MGSELANYYIPRNALAQSLEFPESRFGLLCSLAFAVPSHRVLVSVSDVNIYPSLKCIKKQIFKIGIYDAGRHPSREYEDARPAAFDRLDKQFVVLAVAYRRNGIGDAFVTQCFLDPRRVFGEGPFHLSF